MLRTLAMLALATAPLFSFGQSFVNLYGTAGKSMTNWHGQADVQMLNVEFGKALTKHYDLAFVVAPINVDQPRSWFGNAFGEGNEHVAAISGSVLVRRHWRETSPRASVYAEASFGPMWAQQRVPASTSRFNFISQAGAGVVLRPQSRFPLILGYRFAHISNGGYAPRNPGLNVSSIVIGTKFRR
ncbi:MAG TPA: acyloxyacyl hydrolase [Thermoanaerobaculia bacterium]|nr:acyloxyacyl hydrolase [Thermoanaerobaculia bacterium]